MKYDFKNAEDELLSGRLEMPEGEVKAYAIFAHCFTCTKNFTATSAITKELAKNGIATLRFDFTGLGNSDGDFANTNFSSNVEDLVMGYNALKADSKEVTILIGHSLGGAAVLKASTILKDIESVITIGAPSCTGHVSNLFESDLEEIKQKGHALVNLAGRKFNIKKQFLDDLDSSDVLDGLGKSKKSYLVMHSPVDNTVSVDHAGKIFKALKHPKSFVSLSKVDHLVSKREDAEYIAKLICSWLRF